MAVRGRSVTPARQPPVPCQRQQRGLLRVRCHVGSSHEPHGAQRETEAGGDERTGLQWRQQGLDPSLPLSNILLRDHGEAFEPLVKTREKRARNYPSGLRCAIIKGNADVPSARAGTRAAGRPRGYGDAQSCSRAAVPATSEDPSGQTGTPGSLLHGPATVDKSRNITNLRFALPGTLSQKQKRPPRSAAPGEHV